MHKLLKYLKGIRWRKLTNQKLVFENNKIERTLTSLKKKIKRKERHRSTRSEMKKELPLTHFKMVTILW